MRVGHAFTFFAVAVHVVQVVLVVVFDTDDFSHIPVSRVVELCFDDLANLCRAHEPNYQCDRYQHPINSVHNQLTVNFFLDFLFGRCCFDFGFGPCCFGFGFGTVVSAPFAASELLDDVFVLFLLFLLSLPLFLELCAFRFFAPLAVVIPNRYFLRSSQCSLQYLRSPAVCDMDMCVSDFKRVSVCLSVYVRVSVSLTFRHRQ